MELTLTWRIKDQLYTQTVAGAKVFTLGRSAACDLVLDDPEVAERHAAIFIRDGRFYLGNLSRNKPVELMIDLKKGRHRLAYHKSVALEPGLVFELGPVKIQIDSIQAVQETSASNAARTGKRSKAESKVECSVCRRKVDFELKDCPWCGASLAYGLIVS